jgi:hypothetical protein
MSSYPQDVHPAGPENTDLPVSWDFIDSAVKILAAPERVQVVEPRV